MPRRSLIGLSLVLAAAVALGYWMMLSAPDSRYAPVAGSAGNGLDGAQTSAGAPEVVPPAAPRAPKPRPTRAPTQEAPQAMRKSMDERTPEEQREYLTELIPHAMHMLDIARTNLEKLEKRAANGEDVQEHIDQTRNAIEEGERALKGYRSQLAELKKAPQK